ncbi:MAG TPA: alkaline phosphatase family protein, partial [Polyangia bacterium]
NFAADLAAGTYRFMWISPNLNDDGHDTNLQTADTWCSQEIPKILASQAFKNNGVLFVTWDEGDASLSDQVPMIVVSPLTKAGFQSSVAYTHASYLATVEDTFHLPRLGAAAQAQAMTDFFQ